mmetsp:Transcript_74110/g.154582  ORF Transcript_74110/g.154582 Transcript_74110/m.154582 type:complete len:2199 (+) Transcript_74110:100-6696(+)
MAALLRFLWAAPILLADAGLFLERELPLKVLSTSLGRESDHRLFHSEALTITFSRPVIALGSDWKDSTASGIGSAPFHFESCENWPSFNVPGKARWTTTSIVRFDPDIKWPTDLCFDLVINETLSTYDGVKLQAGTSARWRITSQPLEIRLREITSATASDATGGRWSSRLSSGPNAGKHEAPPDAALYLIFYPNYWSATKEPHSSINHGSIFQTLVSANQDLLGAESEFATCGSNCLKVWPKNISPGQTFRIVYPKQSQPNLVSGPTSEDIFIDFVGLQPFRFDSLSDSVEYRRQRLSLRHGLEGGNATEEQLKDLATSIHIKDNKTNDDVRFTLRQLDEVTLLLELPGLMPERSMVFEVDGNPRICDGLGQALQSSRPEFSTQAVPDSFELPRGWSVLYFRSLNQWEALASGLCKNESNWNSISPAANSRTIHGSPRCPAPTIVRLESLKDILDFNNESLISSGMSFPANTLSLPLNKLLGKVSGRHTLQGLFAEFYPDSRRFVSVASFGASLVPTPSGLLVWATHFEDGAPVENVDVVFVTTTPEESQEGIVQSVLARGKTDAEGLLQLPYNWSNSTFDRNFAVLMEHQDYGLTVVENVQRYRYRGGRRTVAQGRVVTDRRVYQPGDTIYFKGYLRSKESGQMVIPDVRRLRIFGQNIEADVDPRFGTWSCQLQLPADAEDGTTRNYFWEGHAGNGESGTTLQGSSVQVLISEPRPPTVSLTLETPAKAILPGPAAKLPLRLETATYTGASVSAANVTIKWTVRRLFHPTSPPGGVFAGTSSLSRATSRSKGLMQLSGTTTLIADANGKISEDLDVEALLKDVAQARGRTHVSCREGDSVEVEATWVGPTREVVKKSLPGIPVSRSKWEIAVRPSTVGNGPLPGRKYGISTIVRRVAEGGRKDVGGDFQLVASLHEWDGADLPDNLLPTSAWGRQVGVECPLVSRSLESLPECVDTLTNPEAKQYIVLIRGQDPEGVELQTAWAVGKSLEDWKVEMVRDLELELKVRTDKKAYRHGESIKLSFETPLGGDATMLVLLGPAEISETPMEGVPKTLVVRRTAASGEIDVPVDDSCEEACTLRVVLASGVQREEDLLPVKIPTSPLIDVTAPIGLSQVLTVGIVKDAPPPLAVDDVKISIKVTEADAPASVFEPGTEAEIEVTLPPSEAGSEVAIFITDKAMLDVGGSGWPNPLHNVSSELQTDLASGTWSMQWYDLRTNLVATEGLDKTLEISKRREAIDPWLAATGWSTSASIGWLQDVELSDEEYLRRCKGTLNAPPGRDNFEYSATFDEMDDMPDGSIRLKSFARLGSALDLSSGPSPPRLQTTSPRVQRAHFVTTPVFAPSVIVGADGVARHKFKFPDNVGTFQVRVYVVDGKKESRFVSKEEEVTVRRPLTLQPSIPRIARPGDKFEAGVLLTVHAKDSSIMEDSLSVGASVADGSGSIRLIQDVEADTQPVFRPVDAKGLAAGHQEVLFPFEVPTLEEGGQIGVTNLSFVAYQEQSVLDSLVAPITVKPDQAPVCVATSLTIPATRTGSCPAKERVELPEEAVPGSGSIELTASVGHLESVLAASEPLLRDRHLTAWDMLKWLLAAAALRPYMDPSAQPSPDSMGFRLMQVVQGADNATAYLSSSTDNMGLRWLRDEDQRRQLEKDYHLNMEGCRVASLLERLFPGATSVNKEVSDMWRLVAEESLTRKWEELVRSGCNAEENRTRSSCQWTWEAWWRALAEATDCFGREGLLRIAPKSSEELFSNEGIVHNLTPRSQAHFLLGLQMESADGSVESIGQAVLRKFRDRIRIRGRSAYIAETHGHGQSIGSHVSSIFLLSLALVDPALLDSGLPIDRLVEGLAQSLRPRRLPMLGIFSSLSSFGSGGLVQAFAAVALSKYDESRHLTRPNLELLVASGSQPLLEQKIDSDNMGCFVKEVPWDSLPAPPLPLTFSAQGSGEVMVVAALRFVPKAPASTGPIYRGLLVEKVVRRACPISGQPVGPPLQVAPLGTVVVVSIQITTPDDLSSVIVEDYPSGGLELLDPNLDPGSSARSDWSTPFVLVSIKPEVARWMSRGGLRAGSHTVTCRAVATTRGAFSLPSAHAYSADEEELMGLSRAGSFVIVEEGKKTLPDPNDESAVAAFLKEAGRQVQEIPAAPKPCEGGCPNGGVCRPDIGQCGCFVSGVLQDGDCDPPAGILGLRGLPQDSTLINE